MEGILYLIIGFITALILSKGQIRIEIYHKYDKPEQPTMISLTDELKVPGTTTEDKIYEDMGQGVSKMLDVMEGDER